MDNEQKEQRINQVRAKLEEEETDQLIGIWKRNDHEEWTDEALESIQQILLTRLGALPSRETLLAQNGDIGDEDEDKTYYNFDRLTRISMYARTSSWLFLGVAVVSVV